jgi:putative ABC transport system permease protein
MKQDIDEELRFHMEQCTADNIAAGMLPDEAARAARRRFGNVQNVREDCREVRGVSAGESLWQDGCFGVRMLRKSPGFTAVAMLSLALGIGANTAIFSLVHGVLLKPLPFRAPDQLVWISNPVSSDGLPGLTRRSNLVDWKESSASFENLGAYIGFSERINYTMIEHGEPVRVEGALVTEHFLETLGVTLRLGRGFLPEECHSNGSRAIILTERFWKDRFHADASIVGKSVTINNVSSSVVGILPASFDFSSVFTPGARAVDFLRAFQDTPRYDNFGNMMAVVGRLKPGVTVAAAQAELDVSNQHLREAHPERGKFGARVAPLHDRVCGSIRQPFIVLSAAALCVLLIVCVNLSNLLLARGALRQKELAVRVALGAGRARLIWQLLTESLLLSGCGALLGLPIAYLATNTIAYSQAFNIPLLQSARVDSAALGFTVAAAIVTGLVFGLAPALQLSRASLHEVLKEGSRGSSGRGRFGLRQSLIVSEVALACLLLIGAGLLIRSFARLTEVDFGFRPTRAAAWRVVPNRDFATHQHEVSFYRELLDRVRAVPGVESATLATTLPLELSDVVRAHPKGAIYRPGEMPGVFVREAGGMDYFKTLGIPLRAGRDFEPLDVDSVPKGIVVNETLARTFWPARNAVGQILVLENAPDPPADCQVVGVVGDARQSALESTAGPEMFMFGWGGRQLVVRSGDALRSIVPTVRSALREFNPNMAVDEFQPLAQIVERVVSPKRLVARLLALFSALGLVLAAIGIYGIVACFVGQRTREIGIRIALGSPRSAVVRLVIREGMLVAIMGSGLGLITALALTRVLQAQLFGVSPTDPLTFASSAGVLVCVALLACWLPARRATRVDPMVALRSE